MKYFFCLILTLGHLCSYAGQQNIVFLKGSCSAGKTSLGKEITKLDTNWKIIDEDVAYIKLWVDNIAERFPKRYQRICRAIDTPNHFHAIRNNFILFKESATMKERKLALKAISSIQMSFTEKRFKQFKKKHASELENYIFSKIQEGLDENQSILLDCWNISEEQIKAKFSNVPVKKILLHSSLASTLEKFKKRNQESIENKLLANHRKHKQLMPSYAHIYQVTDEKKRKALFCYKWQEMEQIFDLIEQEIKAQKKYLNSPLVVNELTETEFQKIKSHFLPKGKNSEYVFLTAQDDYHLVIDTQDLTPHQTAVQFLKLIKEL